ncbi:MAG: AraC family transcriptional regulator [Oscillospiraceae bacterium]|jgi:AraC-like DNA-binding protein|nr:AraC family transcriptional regulator [Oscillospiraceae bacterium]
MNPQLQTAKAYITEHLTDELTLSAIAGAAGYSAYHFAREFKAAYGVSVMGFVLSERLDAAKRELADGKKIIDAAMEYGFETHAGFTRAFAEKFGCTPSDYAAHAANKKGKMIMELKETSKIVIRPVCKDDVNDLWENVYSAMTPRQITEVKLLPMIEREQRGDGVELVASVDGTVVMSLPMMKVFRLPLGILSDNYFNWAQGDYNVLMGKLLGEMKRHCGMMGISALCSPQHSGSEPVRAFESFGFTTAFSAGGWDYLMLAV